MYRYVSAVSTTAPLLLLLLRIPQVYAWDPYTQNLQMKLVGHRQSIVGVDIVYNPLERAVTVDELGSIKIWNLDRNQGSKAEVVQAVMFQNEAPSRVTHFTSAFKNGTTTTTNYVGVIILTIVII